MHASAAEEPLGALLRRFRLRAGLTLEALAEASTISDRAISDLERGASRAPRRRTLVALADALSLSAAERALVLRSAASAQEEQATQPPLTLEPARLRDFTGRDAQVAAALAALGSAAGPGAQPLVLVCGPGGSGKTSLAIEAAHRSGRRRLFVDLLGHRAGQLQPVAVTRLLLEQLDPDAAHRVRGVEGLLRAWRDASASVDVVVVLDDAVSEEQVRAVHAASACPVVVTSRRSLSGLSGLTRIVLGAMDPDEARALLLRIVPQRGSDAALQELVRLCEGVPLALRIAGNRLAAQPAWTVEDFATRLREEDARLLHLQAGDLAVESTLDLSSGQLDAAHGRAFEQLAVVPGGTFGTAVASQALDDSEGVLGVLDDLADLGLLQTLAGERFRFHELVRLFAAARLERAIGERGVRARRDALFARLLDTAEDAAAWFQPSPEPRPARASAFADEREAQRWLRAEAENWLAAFRAAALRGDGGQAVDAAEHLHWFANLWPRWGGWEAVFETAAEAARGTGRESTMLAYLSWAFRYEQDDLEQGLVAARRAVLTARTLRDVGWAWVHVAAFQLELGETDAAVGSIGRARDALEPEGDEEGLLQTLALLARAEEGRGDPERARERYREVVDRARRASLLLPFSADLTRARAWVALAELALRTGDEEDAAAAADEAIRISRRIHYPLGVARGLRVRASLTSRRADAAHDAASAVAIFEAEGEYALADEVRAVLRAAEEAIAAEDGRTDPVVGSPS